MFETPVEEQLKKAVIELLDHLADVIDGENYERIDNKLYNKVYWLAHDVHVG